MSLTFPVLTKTQSGSLQEFISFWSKLYAYDNAVLYDKIHHKVLSEKDIKDLYQWKNGMKLSQAKEKSLNTKMFYFSKHGKFKMLKLFKNDNPAFLSIYL